jgi:hypothetical protein
MDQRAHDLRRSRGKGLLRGVCLVALAATVVLGVPLAARFLRYTHAFPHTCFRAASLAGERLSYYYLDECKPQRSAPPARADLFELAADGIFRGGRDLFAGGRWRHDPIHVIQASLALHDELIDHPDPEREVILRRQVEWLIHDGIEWRADVPVWPHAYGFERYGLAPPWVSALTQGQAISLLLRAAERFDEPEYARIAGAAARAMLRDDLPFAWRGAPGFFLEEFPGTPHPHALNGCLIAWLGLWDWVRVTGDARARAVCLEFLEAVSRQMPAYERGDWTRYDRLQRRPTSPAYQELHAALAEALAAVSKDPDWAARAQRWRRAAESPWMRTRIAFEVAWAKMQAALAPARLPADPAREAAPARRTD